MRVVQARSAGSSWRKAGRRPRDLRAGPHGCYISDMERADRITILLSVAALCGTNIGTSCSTHARIDDLSARIDAGDASLSARIDDLNTSLNARIDDLRAEVTAQIAAVNARIDALDRDIRDLRALVIDAIQTAEPAAD